MFDEGQKTFWKNFTERSLEDIKFSLKHGREVATLTLMLCFIDALAGFYTGRRDSSVEESWFSFVDRKLKNTKRLNLGRLRLKFGSDVLYSYIRRQRVSKKKSSEIENACALLYSIYRAGLVHNGHLPKNFGITRRDTPAVWCVSFKPKIDDTIIILNIDGLYLDVKSSVDNFSQELEGDVADRREKFERRYDFLLNHYQLEKIL